MTLQALDDLRVLLLEMRESALESASLDGLLEQLGAPQGRPAVVVELDITGDPDLPAAVKLSAFRVAREAITNAARHSAARRVHVRLEQRWDAVTVEITDDGHGFDPEAAASGRHGLSIMQERAEQAGAVLVIDSAPGRGARVRFTWVAPAQGG
jgi:signal transduction histidine kinase